MPAAPQPRSLARSLQESSYLASKGIKKVAGSPESLAEEEEEGEKAKRWRPVVAILMLEPFSITSGFPSREAQRGGGARPGSQNTAISFRFPSVADCWLASLSVPCSGVIVPL